MLMGDDICQVAIHFIYNRKPFIAGICEFLEVSDLRLFSEKSKMIEIETKVMSMQDIWSRDKQLLRGFDPNLQVDWDAQLPNNQEAFRLLVERGEKFSKPQDPIEVNEPALKAAVEDIKTKIQILWGADFIEEPVVELVESARYLPRITEIERDVNAQFGYGCVLQAPPGMFHSPSFGRIVLPRKFLVRVQGEGDLFASRNDIYSKKQRVLEFPWDRAYFESALCEELTHAMFRQLRGEWKKEYVESMKRLGPNKEAKISQFNEVIALHTVEQLALAEKPRWGFYTATDKISLVWGNRYARANYVAVDALVRKIKLAELAMADCFSIESSKTSVLADFYQEHPQNERKMQKFNHAVKSFKP